MENISEQYRSEWLKVSTYKGAISTLNRINSLLSTGKEVSSSDLTAYQIDPKLRRIEILTASEKYCIQRIANLTKGISHQNLSEQFHHSKLNTILVRMASNAPEEQRIFDDVNKTLDEISLAIAIGSKK